MLPTLHTDRLELRPMTLDDAADMFAIFNDERAMRFMPTLPHESVEQTRQMLERELARQGDVQWAIRLNGEENVIGQVHFLGGTRIPGMGYILHPDYWGQGITVEACQPALEYGFTQLAYDRIELWIDETNAASIRVAQKLNFGVKGRIAHKYQHKTQHHFMLVWGLLRDEWHGESTAPKRTRFFGVEPVLRVHDVVKTAEFYRDKLGFHLDFLYGDPPNHGGVSRGEWTGSLISIQLSTVSPEQPITPAGYLYIFVDSSLDDLCETYRANGVEIIAEPTDKPWGLREFAIKDLNGHAIVFGQR